MAILAWINAIFFLFANPTTRDATTLSKPHFLARTYSYGYYPRAYSCPYSYSRGWRFYSPGYFGRYRYGCYGPRAYPRRYYNRDRYYPQRYRYYRR